MCRISDGLMRISLMKLKEATIEELKIILKEEFGYEPDRKELEKIAYSLVGYFDTLSKIVKRGGSEIINET